MGDFLLLVALVPGPFPPIFCDYGGFSGLPGLRSLVLLEQFQNLLQQRRVGGHGLTGLVQDRELLHPDHLRPAIDDEQVQQQGGQLAEEESGQVPGRQQERLLLLLWGLLHQNHRPGT